MYSYHTSIGGGGGQLKPYILKELLQVQVFMLNNEIYSTTRPTDKKVEWELLSLQYQLSPL